MNIAVIGAGAIGCVTGAMLSGKGYDVTLIGRQDQVSAIKRTGLFIDDAPHCGPYNIPASTRLEFAPDVLILAVKTQDVTDACRECAPFAKDAVVVTMQNGVRSDRLAAGVLGGDRIVSSVVMFGATYIEPGRVLYNFPASGLILGLAYPAASGDGGRYLEIARNVFSGAFEIHISDDIHAAHWTKLILNLSNALSAVLGVSLQEAFGDGRICRLGVMIMKEAYGIMESAGIKPAGLPGLPPEKLKSLLYAPPDISAGVYGGIMRGLSKEPLPGSILQSIRRGRKSEVEYLNGEIVALGRGSGFATPLNAKAVSLVNKVEETGCFMKTDELLKEMM
jgi:2-dehydropantoate 2-reductase